ncbi:MAG: type II toxin-antitoxin system RelE/ParE family toxin [Acidobacteria bacterium]|nr:type II toxin-antitoxin system RelE/ParE family toxin [Acidobacteriota bacterium]
MARADVRQLDIPTAMRVFTALQRFADTGEGDITKLKGTDEFRLRVGDYRVRFVRTESHAIQVKRVLHRSEA